MITIINAQLTDIPVIQEIAKRTWPITFQNILSESQIDYMLEMMYSPQALTEQMQEKKSCIPSCQRNGKFRWLYFLST